MRIALVAPLAESVPPKLYGGTERVVSWLAEELVRQRAPMRDGMGQPIAKSPMVFASFICRLIVPSCSPPKLFGRSLTSRSLTSTSRPSQNLALGQMPVAHQSPAAIIGQLRHGC